MTWTKTQPKTEGFYWFKRHTGTGIAKVRIVDPQKQEVFVKIGPTLLPLTDKRFTGYEWSDEPIKPPTTPLSQVATYQNKNT